MRSRKTDSTHLPHRNAFDPELLRRLGERDHPPNTEAAVSGPWEVVATETGAWACRAPGAAEPEVTADEREVALLAAAALPATGRPARFRLADAPEPPFPLLDRAEPAGSVAHFRQELVAAMNVLDALLASPLSLAGLLEAAGAEVLAPAGRILAERVGGEGDEEAGEGGGE